MVRRKEPGEWDPFDGWPFSFGLAGMREEMREMMKRMEVGGGTSSYSYGYRMTVGPDGKRHVEVFGDPPGGLLPTDEGVAALPEISDRDEGPISDVMECGGRFVVTVELPGVYEEDIDITVDGDEITVNAMHGQRTYGKTVHLPGRAIADSMRRTFVNGILEITLDRADECTGDKHI